MHKTRPELLAPAGSPEALRAAVLSGADAVYLAFGDFNARRGAKNFTEESFLQALHFCRLRDVKTYLTLNTLLTDRELPQALEAARLAVEGGISAIIVQDLGLARLLRRALPQLPLHASTQMTIHNLPGVQLCATLGFERVVLARELSRTAIAQLCKSSPIELELFVHGALCMAYSGQCYFSSLLGERSGNRGLCAQPCRLPYQKQGERRPTQPLSLKDLSMAEHLGALSDLGIACLKIEGRMKRPEYVAIVSSIYKRLLDENRRPSAQEAQDLHDAFSRNGFTDGYYEGQQNKKMFGTRPEGTQIPEELLARAQAIYEKESPRFALQGSCRVAPDEAVSLYLQDDAGNTAFVTGPIPEAARSRALTEEILREQLTKLGGSAYHLEALTLDLAEGLSLPLSALNALRRAALEALERAHLSYDSSSYHAPAALPKASGKLGAPKFSLSARSVAQLSDALLAQEPAVVYLPVEEFLHSGARLAPFLAAYPNIRFMAELPRIVWDDERPRLQKALAAARDLGVQELLCGSLGALAIAKEEGFLPRGDFGLGLYNSEGFYALEDLGLSAATVSFELNFAQIRDLQKPIEAEALIYGRLSMMLTEHCLLPSGSHCESCASGCKAPSASLADRRDTQFPILPVFGGRSEIMNAKFLYLADRRADYANLGLSLARLCFTTESAKEAAEVLQAYRTGSTEVPEDHTRGLYFRKVE